MPKFNRPTRNPIATSPVRSERTASGVTYEGAPGYARDAKSELFLLAVTNMVSEDTFYEKAGDRDNRYAELIHSVAIEHPTWLAKFLPWLRNETNMRSAPLVGALEATKALLGNFCDGCGAPARWWSSSGDGWACEAHRGSLFVQISPRQIVDSVLQRPDEPGEALAYWTSRYGRAIPQPVKRGVADAAKRLYNERTLLRYDTGSHGFRFGDVIDLTHPKTWYAWQNDLFRHALDRRHGRETEIPETLRMLWRRDVLMGLSVEARHEISADELAAAGMSWEVMAGWLQGPMDRAAWEKVIPQMGYMALLRNLRNFDDAGVSDEVASRVAAKLADPDEVARSRQLPMRFLSAYRAAPSLRWANALEKALGFSLAGVPALPGRTLVLVDRSDSMFWDNLSRHSDLTRADAAAIFGSVLALRAEAADLVQFGSDSHPVQFRPSESVLYVVNRFGNLGGTLTAQALLTHYNGHDRVVIVTDEQAHRHHITSVDRAVPQTVPTYTWNLAGYKHGHGPSGYDNRHTFGGLSDKAFVMIPLLEAAQTGAWPWEQG